MSHIVAIYDASDPRMRPHCGSEYVHEFHMAHGIDWMHCARFDILADGDGSVIFHMMNLDDPSWRPSDGLSMVEMSLRAPVPAELKTVHQ